MHSVANEAIAFYDKLLTAYKITYCGALPACYPVSKFFPHDNDAFAFGADI